MDKKNVKLWLHKGRVNILRNALGRRNPGRFALAHYWCLRLTGQAD